MKLRVEQLGNPAFERYAIACENGVWYEGEGWTPDQNRAVRYASLHAVKEDWKRLQAEMENGLLVMKASLIVTIKGISDLTPDQLKVLQWHLAAVSEFTLDYSQPMPDGFEHVVLSSQILWDTLRKKKK